MCGLLASDVLAARFLYSAGLRSGNGLYLLSGTMPQLVPFYNSGCASIGMSKLQNLPEAFDCFL
jgi:hypothetical protein